MDITPTTTINNTTPSATTKSPEHDTETPTRINTPTATKALSFSNGVLKRHHHHHHHPIPAAVTYKECLKNHAANLGGHALDGCGEFMPSPTATAADPSSIKCAACGCHRNFHRREPDEPPIASTTHVIEYQPHHRHHPPPPFQAAGANRSPNSASPPPISSSYYPSAPHMLLALSAGLAAPPESTAAPSALTRKRFRTKFSQEQKEKMHKFAEKVGWKMQKRDEDLIHEFCNEIGVDRSVLKGFEEDPNSNIGGGAEDHSEDPSRNHFGGLNVGANANGSSSTS
ncbi:hypothetical protein VIGAN_04051100 [Vigna angularis var. angularis]|uniref:ZF-HD dimerization-type domain-containing protein n=1 Tax=Vigna angularis var. angularis TaxID=157739 RepID=A0A0S3RS26_PHAAN|nr:hypothetical protein VIGAN_04051100 [Vigna angularis var. angularis]